MNWLTARLVDDWHKALTWSSIRLHLAVIGLNMLFAAMPELDPSIAGALPKAFQSPAIGIYAAIALVLRMTKLKPGA